MVTIRLDTSQFRAALIEKMKVVKNKTMPEVINRHAYHISGQAYAKTHVAEAKKIRETLMRVVPATDSRGKVRSGPLAAIIVQKQAKQKNGRGLTKAELPAAIRAFINQRIGRRTFMRAGWIPAMQVFGAKIGRTGRKSRIRVKKGGATAANPGLAPTAILWNEALASVTENPTALEENAGRALQEAMDAEVAGMKAYTARKLGQVMTAP